MNGPTNFGDACIFPNVAAISQMIQKDALALIIYDEQGRLPIHRCVYHDNANVNLNALILIKGLSKANLKKFKRSKVEGIDVRLEECEVSFRETTLNLKICTY